METMIKVAEQQAAQKTQSAILELESLARTLQKAAQDLAAGNAQWWSEGVNTVRANALLVQAASAQQNAGILKNIEATVKNKS